MNNIPNLSTFYWLTAQILSSYSLFSKVQESFVFHCQSNKFQDCVRQSFSCKLPTIERLLWFPSWEIPALKRYLPADNTMLSSQVSQSHIIISGPGVWPWTQWVWSNSSYSTALHPRCSPTGRTTVHGNLPTICLLAEISGKPNQSPLCCRASTVNVQSVDTNCALT